MPKTDASTELLAYRPSRESVELGQALQQHLETLDRKLATTNHIPTIAAQRDQNLPAFKLLTQFVLFMQADMTAHVSRVAQFLADQIEPTVAVGVPPDLSEAIRGFFARVSVWNASVQGLLSRFVTAMSSESVEQAERDALKALAIELAAEGGRLNSEMQELGGVVDDETYDDSEDEEGDEDEDEDEDDDEDDDSDADDSDAPSEAPDEEYVPLLGGQ